MVPYPNHESTQTGPRVESVALVFGRIVVFESYSDETLGCTATEGPRAWPVYLAPGPPKIDPKALFKGRTPKDDMRRRELHFSRHQGRTLEPHIKRQLFSRRLEGGRAQRHRQKWKLRRQKAFRKY